MYVVEWSIGYTINGIVLKPIITGINLAGMKPIFVLFGYVYLSIQVAKCTVLLIKKPGIATDARVYQISASVASTRQV